jgi:hypothetical protein
MGSGFSHGRLATVTFVHQFNRRVRCTVTTTDGPPPRGESHVLKCEWTELPKPKHVREYVRWMAGVNRHLADTWGKRMLHAVQVGPRTWEFWQFEPGKPPKLANVLRP